jgi:hypothetical protein
MRRSEIFESFVKIAEEKGLISKGTPEENKADLERTHRADSLSIDDIAHLYGVKPDAPADAKYKRNIIEVAHPEPVVIAPSYDKLNALVENDQERQNILLHIVNKTNDGSIAQRKYAQRELVLSLVRLGNDMDNRGQDDLCALADVCLRQSSSGAIKKQAQWQIIIPTLAMLAGGFYAKQHLPFHSDGFDIDYQKAVKELDDLVNSNDNWGVGYKLNPSTIQLAQEIKGKLGELKVAVDGVLDDLDKLQKPKSGPELQQMLAHPDTKQSLAGLQQFQAKTKDIVPYLNQVIADFTSDVYKQRQVSEKGVLTQMVDSTGLLHGGTGAVSDDFDDVAHALQTVVKDVNNIQRVLDNSAQIVKSQEATLSESSPVASENSLEAAPGTSVPSVAPEGAAHSAPQEVQTRSLERELEDNPDLTEFLG